MSDDKRLARIRALLAKAEDPAATPAEADIYNAKAAQLIADYGIDAALLDEATPDAARPGDRQIVLDAPYAIDKRDLLWAILEPLRCKGVARKVQHGLGSALVMHVFGMEADLDRAELLFTSLLVQAAHGLATARPSYGGESTTAYRRTWLAGFSNAVHVRLADAERAAALRADRDRAAHPPAGSETSARGVAVVLADRSALVQDAARRAHPAAKPTPARQLAGSGQYDGYRAGERADLGGRRLGGPGRRAVDR